MTIADPPKKVYSINEAYYTRWSREQQRLVTHLKTDGGFGSRYIGSFVADIHRTIQGKLRLMYEANPMAMIIEQAGGCASDGSRRIMEIEPETLHQRTPLYMGSKEFVELAEGYLAGRF
jgi:fructose-1,6-bisphosphatase I